MNEVFARIKTQQGGLTARTGYGIIFASLKCYGIQRKKEIIMGVSKKEIKRLDGFLSSQLGITRSEAKELIKKHVVTVNGKEGKLYDMKIDPENDSVCVRGEEIDYRKNIYIMLNKPQGVVCSTKDGLSKTVLELLPPELRRAGLFPAGRLDKDTEGFVLITDDGALAHNILSPRRHVEKVYFARLEKPATQEDVRAFESGLEIDGGDICKPAKLEILSDCCDVMITLHEGMYHQIKRMAYARGNKVLYLKRISIGNLALDENLLPGECREILHKEIEKI